jgi:hypothetical protein
MRADMTSTLPPSFTEIGWWWKKEREWMWVMVGVWMVTSHEPQIRHTHQIRARRLIQEPEPNPGVPGLAVTEVAQGSPEHGLEIVETIHRLIGHGVAVRIALELAGARDVDDLGIGEQLVARNLGDFSVLEEACRVRGRHEHAARRPGELVTDWIGVGFGRRHATAVGPEADDLPPIALCAMDHAHRRHVIQSGIHAAFVDESEPGSTCVAVEHLHLRRNIGGRGHVLGVSQTHLRDRYVLGRRQEGHGDVMIGD